VSDLVGRFRLEHVEPPEVSRPAGVVDGDFHSGALPEHVAEGEQFDAHPLEPVGQWLLVLGRVSVPGAPGSGEGVVLGASTRA
jgi:hypothetical protein